MRKTAINNPSVTHPIPYVEPFKAGAHCTDQQADKEACIPRPIEDHGIIGDMSTAALVACDGTIDFLCWPRFDSPSIFAALLDPERGGTFEFHPDIADARVLQMYLPDSNVLITRWQGREASAEIIDAMPVRDQTEHDHPRIIRRLLVTRGTVTFRLSCQPRFNYGQTQARLEKRDDSVIFHGPDDVVVRLSGPQLQIDSVTGAAAAVITASAGEAFDYLLDDNTEALPHENELEAQIHDTVVYWQNWVGQSSYRGRWRDKVMRSALVLKLMTSRRYGAVIAAPTFSLPEAPGGVRNWDYRATWVRDASFSVYALIRLGYVEEAKAFTSWISDRTSEADWDGSIRVMYNIDGKSQLTEKTLDHLRGYGGAAPVRIGNGAADQLQLDVYGELADTIYLSNKYGSAISHADWKSFCCVIDRVCKQWDQPDAGIWEVRGEPQHFLHSRLMSWVALDRAIRLAGKRSLAAPLGEWLAVRDAISNDIWDTFWDKDAGHFVRAKGTRDLDASLLMMPLVRFIGATDPAWLATLDAITDQLVDDGMVYRYRCDDGLPGEEGAFAACSFWYVECLARAGRLRQARFVFEKLMNYSNHLGLYAEEFGPHGELAGNFPQAFTHLALISAAFYLDREIDGKNDAQWRP